MKQPRTLLSCCPAAEVSGDVKTEKVAADFWSAAGSIIALQTSLPPLRHLESQDEIPLSLAQERLWSLEQSEPGEPYYHIPLTWEIEGKIDLGALEQSFNFLVRRHEALRTSFPSSGSGPRQHLNQPKVSLSVDDLSGLPLEQARAESWKRARRFVQLPMDLETGPLMRVAIYRRAPEEHWLVAVFHQMIFDGASMRIVNRELGLCYAAYSAGREPALDPLPITYADFSRWQLDCARESKKSAAYWQSRLQKEYQPLRLPARRRDTTAALLPAAHLPIHLPKPLVDALKELALAKDVTAFAAFLGSFQGYLSRLTQQADVLTFASMAARTHSALRNMVGLIANVLPLRLDLEGNPTFNQLLKRSGEMVSGAVANQTVPLSQILEGLSVSRNEAPALQTLIIYNNAPLPPLKLGEATFKPSIALDNGTSKFDFTLDVSDSPEGICGFLKYRTDLYGEDTAQSLLRGWESFLRQGLAEPDQPIGAIAIDQVSVTAEGLESASKPGNAGESRTGRTVPYAPPATPLEKKLTALWESVFGISPIGINDNFFGLGGNSLAALKLVGSIEKETAEKLRLSVIFQQPTISRLAKALENSHGRTDQSIIEIQPHGSKPPLFLVHGVGGGMFWGYNNLARQLGTDQPVYGFKSRGLEGLEEFTKIEEIAAHYVADLLKFQPKGPFCLGGYCFGGNVAYEMARQLRAQNHEVTLLLLINCWANNSSYSQVKVTPKFLLGAATNFLVRSQHQVGLAIENPRDFFKWRAAWIVRRVKTLFASNPEDRLSVDDIVNLSSQSEEERKLWQTHVRAWLQYRPQPYDGPLVLFRTRGHPLVCSFDHQMGWGEFARGGVSVRVCPGDHESILEEENVAEVARELSCVLRDLLPGGKTNSPIDRSGVASPSPSAATLANRNTLVCIPPATTAV